MEREQQEAFFLRRVPYRDSDLILTMLTRDRGRLSALARSARASRRRFPGGLDLFSVYRVEYTRKPGSELATLTGATTVHSFASLAGDLGTFSQATYAIELVRELSPAEQPEPEVFDLLVALFSELARAGADRSVLRAFELGLLARLGLAPVLGQCVSCARAGESMVRRALLDPERGGAVCGECGSHSRTVGVRPLSEGARQYLASLQVVSSLAAAREIRGDRELLIEARDASFALIGHHLGKSLKTLEFVRQLAAAS